MPRRGSGREEPRIEVDIGRDTTSLVIRRLPQHITTERLVEVLRESSRGRFDFVHVPHDQQTGLNVALAFVNFVDHDAAEKAYRTRLMRPNGGRNPLGPIRIRPGTIQGLGPNLAYFTTRFGLDALEGLSAPQVFEGGQRVPLTVSFLRKYVTVDMMKSQLDELAGSDPVISSRIEDAFSLLFPAEASAAPRIPADISLSGDSTAMSGARAWLDGNPTDPSSKDTRDTPDSIVVAPSFRSDLSSSSNDKDAGGVPLSPEGQTSVAGCGLECLAHYSEGGMTVFQL
mmetsp:Transcript_27387/g.64385  ORF Transcript_27387/g.64385 Transcript_27387/m.64385 type:complete len:285 (+) Transcript_27387:113-967(+)